MPFNRSRYITLCQQTLVTAAVLAVGVSAAGVRTLDIVPQPSRTTGTSADAHALGPDSRLVLPTRDGSSSPSRPPAKTPVDTAPVTPKVKEVAVKGVHSQKAAPKAERRSEGSDKARRAPATERPQPESTPESAGKKLVAESAPQDVQGFATVGVTWEHGKDYADDQIAVQVRTMKQGAWSSWTPVEYHDEHGPDGSEGSAAAERPGTDALVIGDVDKVQMRAETADGSMPPGLRLAVIDPGTGEMTKAAPAIDTSKLDGDAPQATQQLDPADGQGAGDQVALSADTVALSAMKVAPKPYIYSRAQWGANERLREQSRPSYGTIKTGFIHHTVNSNGYSKSQVPALLRGIYAYHTQSRGWRDIGYNFLVDRFGRIWEGRWGGVDKAVVGAHTLGYNEVSFAMSAIGNFDTANPPQAVSDAYARLFAWKLSMYNIRADAARLRVKSRYLHAINGHRDVGSTACPGRYLYAKLPAIRTATQRLQNAAQTGAKPAPSPTPKPTPAPPPATGPDAPMSSPTQTPLAASDQPSIKFPARNTNIVSSGYPDVVLKSSSGAVSILPTGGQIDFGAPVHTWGNWAQFDIIAVAGDLTGDGKGDLIARIRSNKQTRIYPGDGAGKFRTPGIRATQKFRVAARLVGVGDWNRDRRNDVLMVGRGGWLWLYPGRGNGTFAKRKLLSKKWASYTETVGVGDITRDGRPDLVVKHRNGRLYVVPSAARSKLAKPRLRRVVGSGTSLIGSLGDMTGDRIGDLALRQGTATNIVRGRSGGYLGETLGSFSGAAGLRHLGAGQLTGNSRPDLFGMSADGKSLVVLPHNGRYNMGSPVSTGLVLPKATQVFNAGDWNRDGRADLITRQESNNKLKVRLGRGGGKFRAPVSMKTGWKSFTNIAPVGDVTGDGNPDLVAKTARGKMTIFPGDGKTGFLAPRLAPAKMQSYNMVGNGTWSTGVFPGAVFVSSDGSFVPFVGSNGGPLSSYSWVVGPGDADGDGRADLLARDRAGNLWLLPGNDSSYAARRLVGTGLGGYVLGG